MKTIIFHSYVVLEKVVTCFEEKFVKMSNSGTDDEFLDIEEEADRAIANLLPDKSKHLYEKAYKAFKDWCLKKKVGNIVNESVLLVYFTKELKDLKASTAWSTYSMLRATLNIKENIEIKKFHKLRAHLKKRNKGYRSKQSAILTKEQIYQFVRDAPDIEYLAMKVTFTNLFLCNYVTVYAPCFRLY